MSGEGAGARLLRGQHRDGDNAMSLWPRNSASKGQRRRPRRRPSYLVHQPSAGHRSPSILRLSRLDAAIRTTQAAPRTARDADVAGARRGGDRSPSRHRAPSTSASTSASSDRTLRPGRGCSLRTARGISATGKHRRPRGARTTSARRLSARRSDPVRTTSDASRMIHGVRHEASLGNGLSPTE